MFMLAKDVAVDGAGQGLLHLESFEITSRF